MCAESHGRLQQLDQALESAFDAALEAVRGRSREVILAARLATAVQMGLEAESTEARDHAGDNYLNEVSSQEAASVEQNGAALLVRRGGAA